MTVLFVSCQKDENLSTPQQDAGFEELDRLSLRGTYMQEDQG